MKTNFFIDCRWYKTPCKTVLNADEFVVEFFTDKHSIAAKVSDKCYFLSIDNITLSDIKCDFFFSRHYTNPKEFLSKLYDTFNSFLNTSIPFTARHCPHSTDDIIGIILGNLQMKEVKKEFKSLKKQTLETKSETVSDSETEKELEKIEKELIETEDTHIEDIKKFKEKAELNENYGVIADEKFHQLTKTLIKSLFKAIGIEDTRKISFTIANGIVFFNYKGTQCKYYPSQCKIFKKRGGKYQRINWKDFAEENNSDGQKQFSGRSPPFLLRI